MNAGSNKRLHALMYSQDWLKTALLPKKLNTGFQKGDVVSLGTINRFGLQHRTMATPGWESLA